MKKIAVNFFTYLKKPQEKFTENLSAKQKWKIFGTIYLIDFAFALVAATFLHIIDTYIIELNEVESFDTFNEMNALTLLFLVVLLVPLIEEFFFRLYLNYDRNFLFIVIDSISNNKAKLFWNKHFKFFFYFSAFIFGLVHITNFSNNSLLFYALTPFIISSQFFGGLTIGFLRLKLGFFWGFLQHALHNFIIFFGVIFFFNNTIISEVENKNFSLQIETLELRLNKPIKLATYKTGDRIDSIIGTNTTVKHLAEILDSKDSVLFKKKKLINIKFINKTDSEEPKSIILTELLKEIKSF